MDIHLQNLLPLYHNKSNQIKRTDSQKIPNENNITSNAEEQIQQYLEKINENQFKTDMNKLKVGRINAKFDAGEKLSQGEFNYLLKHSPEQAGRVMKITMERELNESLMRFAPTKDGVQFVAFQALNGINKSQNAGDRLTRMNHLIDAKRKYEKTEEFRTKPNTPVDSTKRIKNNVIRAYEPGNNLLWGIARLAYEK